MGVKTKSLVHSLGAARGDGPDAVIRLGYPAPIHTLPWPVLRLTLTASLESAVASQRRSVATSTWGGGGQTIKHTAGVSTRRNSHPRPPGILHLSVYKSVCYDSLILT